MTETLSLKGEKTSTHFVAAFSVCFIKLIATQQVNEPQESCRFQSNHCKLQDRKKKNYQVENIANLLQELLVITKEIKRNIVFIPFLATSLIITLFPIIRANCHILFFQLEAGIKVPFVSGID